MTSRLPRRAWLDRRARLRPGKGLARHVSLRQVSARRAAADTSTQRTQRDTGPDRATREVVLERDDYTCGWCGQTILGRPYSLQHRRSRGDGGSSDPRINAPSNLITLCGSATSGCHLKCKQAYAEAEHLGFVVSLNSGTDPAAIPVHHALYGRVLLHDDGTVTPVEAGAA